MTIHKPVLLREAIEGLNLKPGAVVVDATLGGGGHSVEILKRIGENGKLIAVDIDKEAIKKFKSKVGNGKPGADNFLVEDNFANLKGILRGLGVKTADAVLADLGFSSDQMEDAERGFSFRKDAPLDMRLDRGKELTAKKVVNEYSPKELERILKIYGEEKFARSIVQKIVAKRNAEPIERTLQLASVVESAVPEKYKHQKISPATRTFQAIRIEVNKELENLERFIPQAIEALSSGGRLGIITFHSLEDRIVKNIFRVQARGCLCPKDFPVCRCAHKAKIKIITKKPVVPSIEELESNPRARSSKLRIAERI